MRTLSTVLVALCLKITTNALSDMFLSPWGEVCDNDALCPPDKTCIGQHCLNSCSVVKCPDDKVCRVMNHTASCITKPVLKGECISNENCALDKVCVYYRCIDPCNSTICGHNAHCNVTNHLVTCTSKPVQLSGSNTEVNSDIVLVLDKAQEPCGLRECKDKTRCGATNRLTVHINSRDFCDVHEDCGSEKSCISGKCIDPCKFTLCEDNCRVTNHKAKCISSDSCSSDCQCESTKACVGGSCIDPCTVVSKRNKCKTVNHKAEFDSSPVIVQQNCIPPNEKKECWKKEFVIETTKHINSSGFTWHQAWKVCNVKGMEMVEILNEEESNLFKKQFESVRSRFQLHPRSGIWIGLTDLPSYNVFSWNSGREIDYKCWNTTIDGRKEPNNSGGDEHCVEFYALTFDWNDLPCTTSLDIYACQYYKWDDSNTYCVK